MLSAKDGEIADLKRQLPGHSTPQDRSTPLPEASTVSTGESATHADELPRSRTRRGKAPPVDPFTGEDLEVRLDDWLPSLGRAKLWNDWTEEELILQLAGHLRGRALQEWGLLSADDKKSYTRAVEALKSRLDPGSRTLAAQEFRHTTQGEAEKVADFIRRLERTFNVAYGREGMSTETRDALLHGQLQDALKHELMQAPAVSGAQTYNELCLTARNEEKRLAELKKRQQYLKPSPQQPQQPRKTVDSRSPSKPVVPMPSSGGNPANQPTIQTKKCFLCHEPGHLASNCRRRIPGRGRSDSQRSQSGSKQVTSHVGEDESKFESLRQQLYSSDDSADDDEVRMVRLTDQGSRPQCVKLQVQGVPAYSIIDSRVDITIMGGNLFKKVAAVAKFRKRDLKKPDKTPRNYDHTPFALDGRIDMDLTFDDKTMCTPVYIKVDAHDQLLLSEGVCRQLGILKYHSEVEPWRGGRKQKRSRTQARRQSSAATPASGGADSTRLESRQYVSDFYSQ